MPVEAPAPARGLWKNGNRWWMRVLRTPVSTGTDDIQLAGRVANMVAELQDSTEAQREWLSRVSAREVTLLEVYRARSAGTLHLLREKLARDAASAADADLGPWVHKWITEHLPSLGLRPHTIWQYTHCIRALVPEGVRFPKSKFTEETLAKALQRLREPRSGLPLTGSTKRRYVAAWKLFYRYARRRVPLEGPSPFDEADWIPANNSPRTVFWDHATTMRVLGRMTGEAKVAITLVFGSGIELGALGAMRGRDVGVTPADPHTLPTIVAPGSKNEAREWRTVFVNRWAWDVVRGHADGISAKDPLFTLDPRVIREEFYRAQVAEGLVDEPPKSDVSGKPLWGAVDPHTIHDARHTYCVVRLLGLDGEPRQSIKFCSTQLGHSDEQMVMRIYGKANIEMRLRQLEQQEARRRNT